MAIFSITNLKNRINTYIRQNFLQLITGPVLQGILHDIVDSLKALIDDIIISLTGFLSKSDIREGQITTTQTETEITFDPPFPEGTTYNIMRHCTNSEGDVWHTITNRTKDGFILNTEVGVLFEYQCKKL